jgi:uncharacterized damage-inducible protein DinB
MQSVIAELFLDYSAGKLREMAGCVEACFGRLSEEQIWQRQATHENTIGNLILHLCGNIRQWIMHGVADHPDVRARDLEFSTSSGLAKAKLLALFLTTVAEAESVIAGLPPERLSERTDPQRLGEVSVLAAIYQVVGHMQQHTGQIILLTKQMAGGDLDLTIPRSR